MIDAKMDEQELITILADYSYDLAELKKRNGALPLQTAVKRITRYVIQKQIEELRDLLTQYYTITGSVLRGLQVVNRGTIDGHIAKLQAELKDL